MLTLLRSNYCNHCSHAINLSFKRAITTSQLQEYYTILNVDRSSTQKEIKDSFLKLSKVYHPDNKKTGSHLKFVKLKEAYDAIKDGSPSVTSSTYSSSQSSASSSPWSSYEQSRPPNDTGFNNEDMNRSAHAYYRYRQRQHEARHSNGGFGGPFANSSTAWEDMKKDYAYRKKQKFGPFGGRTFVHTTLFLSAIAWIFIYSGVLLIWEHNDRIKAGLFSFKPRNHADYVAYEEYLRRKERENLMRSRLRQTITNTNNVKTVTDEGSPQTSAKSEIPKVVEIESKDDELKETIDSSAHKQLAQ